METNYNVEYEMLQLKLEVIESSLQTAIDRAEKAEAELERVKRLYESKYGPLDNNYDFDKQQKTHHQQMKQYSIENKSTNTSPIEIVQPPTFKISAPSKAPPPPPPLPPPQFNLTPTNNHSGTSLTDGVAGMILRNQRVGAGNQQVKATGR